MCPVFPAMGEFIWWWRLREYLRIFVVVRAVGLPLKTTLFTRDFRVLGPACQLPWRILFLSCVVQSSERKTVSAAYPSTPLKFDI